MIVTITKILSLSEGEEALSHGLSEDDWFELDMQS